MNLEKFNREQLQILEQDLDMFVYNEDYCLQACNILLREVQTELISRQNVIELEPTKMPILGFLIGIGLFIGILFTTFIFSGFLYYLIN